MVSHLPPPNVPFSSLDTQEFISTQQRDKVVSIYNTIKTDLKGLMSSAKTPHRGRTDTLFKNIITFLKAPLSSIVEVQEDLFSLKDSASRQLARILEEAIVCLREKFPSNPNIQSNLNQLTNELSKLLPSHQILNLLGIQFHKHHFGSL